MLSVDERYKKFLSAYTPQMNQEIEALNKTADEQKAVITDTYNTSISEAKKSYADIEERNAIQKIVNERQLQERMSNMGLTDSGLNRTQQAAVQLSYANTKSKIERQKQSAEDAFVREMNAKLTSIETDRISGEASIRKSYDSAAMTAAQNEYKTEYDAETERYKAAIKAQGNIIKPNVYSFSYIGNDGLAYYTDSNGKSVKKGVGINPYTSVNNTLIGNANKKWNDVKNLSTTSDSQKAVALYGTFSNGYQPKGVVSNNKHYGIIKGYADEITTAYGTNQKVWETKGEKGVTRFWLWDGYKNAYIQVEQQNGLWIEV